MSRRRAPRLDKTIGGLSSTLVTYAAANLGLAPGAIAMPAGFAPTLPCTFTREADGSITHDMDFDQYRTGTEVWVNSATGNDSTGTGASGAPYRSMAKAWDVVVAGGDVAYVIKTSDTFMSRTYGIANSARTLSGGKRVSIIGTGANPTKLTAANDALTWTEDGTGTWKATRSAVTCVLARTVEDADGIPTPVPAVTSSANCQSTANSWYTDGTYVWVHTSDGLAPTVSTHMVCVSVTLLSVTLTGGAALYLENIDLLGAEVTINGDANVQGTFVTNGVRFAGGDLKNSGSTVGNSLSAVNVKNVYLFDTIAAYAARDGFNYHYALIPSGSSRRSCLALEYGCLSRNHGLYNAAGNNNATTSHEGATTLRINTEAHTTTGPVLADIDGTFSVCIDTYVHDSSSASYDCYLFSNTGGESHLINCRGGGVSAYDVHADAEVDIYGRFRGHKYLTAISWH